MLIISPLVSLFFFSILIKLSILSIYNASNNSQVNKINRDKMLIMLMTGAISLIKFTYIIISLILQNQIVRFILSYIKYCTVFFVVTFSIPQITYFISWIWIITNILQ